MIQCKKKEEKEKCFNAYLSFSIYKKSEPRLKRIKNDAATEQLRK